MSIPHGWKLVPVEPTQEMKTAGISVEVYPDSPPELACLTWAEAKAIYQAMLDTAPPAPAQQDDALIDDALSEYRRLSDTCLGEKEQQEADALLLWRLDRIRKLKDDEALEVLQTIVSAYDKFKLARGYSDDRNEWILAARTLLTKRGAA